MKYNFDNVPEELKDHEQWVGWKYEPDLKAPEVLKKPPMNPFNGKKASVTKPETWSSFEDAVSYYEKGGVDGIGVVLTEKMGITVIDIDDCRNKKTGKLTAYAQKIMRKFPSYAEISPSGAGIHIFLYGTLPGKGINASRVEVYDRSHYMTVTGNHVVGSLLTIKRYHNRLQKWYATLTKPTQEVPALQVHSKATDTLSDIEIIVKVLERDSKGVFSKLLSGDISSYPSQSEADLGFCSLVSEFTNSPDTIDRLFRNSKLMRPKWDEKHGQKTYGYLTISKALESPHASYGCTLHEKSTEYEIAKAVIKRVGRKNLYCLAKQNWLWIKTKGVWSVVEDEVIKKRIHNTAHVKSISNSRVNSVFGLITTEVYSTVSRFSECNKHVINCNNGEIHFEDNDSVLKKHNRDSNCCFPD